MAQFKEEKAEQYSALTMESYISDLNQFIDFIEKDLEDIKKTDIDNFIGHVLTSTNKYSGEPLKPKTANKKLVALRQFIEWLNGNTDIKIFTEIKLLEIQKQEYLSENILSSNDFERLIRVAEKTNDLQGKQALALFYGLYYTGLRIS